MSRTLSKPAGGSLVPWLGVAMIVILFDQLTKIAEFGGREAILTRGSFGYSPAPGTKPVYN